jgi:hypothetical protein
MMQFVSDLQPAAWCSYMYMEFHLEVLKQFL